MMAARALHASGRLPAKTVGSVQRRAAPKLAAVRPVQPGVATAVRGFSGCGFAGVSQRRQQRALSAVSGGSSHSEAGGEHAVPEADSNGRGAGLASTSGAEDAFLSSLEQENGVTAPAPTRSAMPNFLKPLLGAWPPPASWVQRTKYRYRNAVLQRMGKQGAAVGIAAALWIQRPALAAPLTGGGAGGGPMLPLNIAMIAFNVLSFLAVAKISSTIRREVRDRTKAAVEKFKAQWKGALFIPVVAAIVGWITNWIAVQMIFYPINYVGLPIKTWVLGSVYGCDIHNPLGIIGWQGIVPAKAAKMSFDMVTMVTEKLVNVQARRAALNSPGSSKEVFMRLSPNRVAELLSPQIPLLAKEISLDVFPKWAVGFAEGRVLAGALPGHIRALVEAFEARFLAGFTRALQENIDRVLDLKELVVTSMVGDKRLVVEMFWKCGQKELDFLVNSGLWFGFLLGIIQMVIWMYYDSPWTLTAGGAVVGYITNWLALKCIFEPVEPTKFGPFILQGTFLKRQREVSAEFADFFVDRVLTSKRMWENMVNGIKAPEFRQLLKDHTCGTFVPEAAAQLAAEGPLLKLGAEEMALATATCEQACDRVADRILDHVHPVHGYVDQALDLRRTIKDKLELMTPIEFERVLHPIFEEDEMTLIIAGGVLGAIAGYIQQVTTVPSESQQREQAERKAKKLAAEGGGGGNGAGGGSSTQ